MHRPARRFVQLYAGLVLYGVSMAMLIRAELGLDPWDVFHQGVSEHTGLSFGTVVTVTGGVVLLAWLPLHERPGIGTVSNVLVIGVAVDVSLALMPPARSDPVAVALLLGGVFLLGVASGAYIGAGLGPGPRDGLMTGLVRRTGGSIGVVRTSIEVTVLAVGFALGGTVGIGTVVYALSIGPLVHVMLPRFEIPRPAPALA
jgi:uncharacterized membrane protein YczE